MKIYRIITEPIRSGLQKDKSGQYATGWKRRVGSQRVPTNESTRVLGVHKGPDGNFRTEDLWEEAPAPRTFVQGSPEFVAALEDPEDPFRGGGTVQIIFEDIPTTLPRGVKVNGDEIDLLVRHYVRELTDALHFAGGGTSNGAKMDKDEALGKAEAARLRIKELTGYDVIDSNVVRDF